MVTKVAYKHVREYAQIADFQSKADCILYTYGTAGGYLDQESPPFMLEMAEQYPRKTFEMIHFDERFTRFIQKGTNTMSSRDFSPSCLRSRDWTVENSGASGVYQARHVKFPNLMVKFINKWIPTAKENEDLYKEFSKRVGEKLSRSVDIYLGCYGVIDDIDGIFSAVFNSYYTMPNIHFHMHTEQSLARVFKDQPYPPSFGSFVDNADWSSRNIRDEDRTISSTVYSSLKRVCSPFRCSFESDIQTVRSGIHDYLKATQKDDRLADEYFEAAQRMLIIPIHDLKAAVWRGESPFQYNYQIMKDKIQVVPNRFEL
jgi:hypothetical protein